MSDRDKLKNFVIKTFIGIKNFLVAIVDFLQKIHDRKSPVYFVLAILIIGVAIKLCLFDINSQTVLHRNDQPVNIIYAQMKSHKPKLKQGNEPKSHAKTKHP